MTGDVQTSHQTRPGDPAVAGARAESAPVTKAGELAAAVQEVLKAWHQSTPEDRRAIAPDVRAVVEQLAQDLVRDELNTKPVGDPKARLKVLEDAATWQNAILSPIFEAEVNGPGFCGPERQIPSRDDRREVVRRLNILMSHLRLNLLVPGKPNDPGRRTWLLAHGYSLRIRGGDASGKNYRSQTFQLFSGKSDPADIPRMSFAPYRPEDRCR